MRAFRISTHKGHSTALLLLLYFFSVACQGQERLENTEVQKTAPAFPTLDVDPYFVETQTKESRLGPRSITRNMVQDKDGNIWLATWEGILQYDGNTFTNFTNKAGLRRFHAFAAMEDSRGNLWFSTIGAGIYRYDGEHFTNFSTKDGIPSDRVTYLYEDSSGHIWIGTEGGASRYDGKNFKNYTTADGLPSNDVNTIIEDQHGIFWLGTRGQACTYDGKTFTEIETAEGQLFSNVRCIIEDSKGHIWLGGNNGLWRYDGSNYSNYTKDFVGYIYEDSRENIWTSSATAHQVWTVSRYEGAVRQQEDISATEVFSKAGMFFGILEDRNQHIWFGNLDGVYRYDGVSFDDFRK